MGLPGRCDQKSRAVCIRERRNINDSKIIGGTGWVAQLHAKEVFSQTIREGGVPEFGTPHPARDYPSAPSVDLKHDRGNCAVGDVRDRWKESETGRGHYLNRGGHSPFSLC